jgi:D-methionine transport system ATP-binding protein
VLTRTLREHRVDGTVVFGGITEVAERPYGSLTVELVGDPAAVDAAVAALRDVTWVDDHGRAAA